MNKRWLEVAVLVMLVLTGAMGVKALANTTSPVPPTPWHTANTTSPVPPTPW